MAGFFINIFLNDKKLPSHMSQIIQHTNYINHKFYSNDLMIKMIVNLVSKRVYNDENSSPRLSCLHSSLIISIVDTPENYLSRGEVKYVTSKVNTYSVKSSLT